MAVVLTPVFTAIVLLITFMLLSQDAAAGPIPKPDAANIFFDVSVSHMALIDSNRKYPDCNNPVKRRKVMVSLFFPIPRDAGCAFTTQSYFPDATAKTSNAQFFGNENQNVFELLTMSTCTSTNRLVTNADHPLIILEPNIGTSRLLYSALAQEWAAGGYAVVAIDHPSDVNVVEFSGPDVVNQTMRNSIQIDPFVPTRDWNSTVSRAHDTRIQDISFVVDSLKDPATLQQLLDAGGSGLKLTTSFNTSNIAVVGHGFGGAVATTLGATDPRVQMSINMGGTAKLQKDTTGSVIFFGRQGASRDDDANWPKSWKYLHGRATEWDLQGAGMFDFSDLPLISWASSTGVSKCKIKGLAQIDARKAFDITKNWVRAYLDIQFGPQEDRALYLTQQVLKYPEMQPYSPPDYTYGTPL